MISFPSMRILHKTKKSLRDVDTCRMRFAYSQDDLDARTSVDPAGLMIKFWMVVRHITGAHTGPHGSNYSCLG